MNVLLAAMVCLAVYAIGKTLYDAINYLINRLVDWLFEDPEL